jgi:hypothetical protein
LLIFRNKKLRTVSQHYVESKNNCVWVSIVYQYLLRWHRNVGLFHSGIAGGVAHQWRGAALPAAGVQVHCLFACPINIHIIILPPVFRIRKIFFRGSGSSDPYPNYLDRTSLLAINENNF